MKIDFVLNDGRVITDVNRALAIRAIQQRSEKIVAVKIDGYPHTAEDALFRLKHLESEELKQRIDSMAIAMPPIIVPADSPLLKEIKRYDDAVDAATYLQPEMMRGKPGDALVNEGGKPVWKVWGPNDAMIERDGPPAPRCPLRLEPRHYDRYSSIVMDRAIRVTHEHFNDSTWPGNFLK